jgi:hypothetical protein
MQIIHFEYWVRVAEAIREDAAQILLTLHRQGEQINQTHRVAADIEQDLTVVSSALCAILANHFFRDVLGKLYFS